MAGVFLCPDAVRQAVLQFVGGAIETGANSPGAGVGVLKFANDPATFVGARLSTGKDNITDIPYFGVRPPAIHKLTVPSALLLE
jgi:hypothetical protein